MQETTLTFFFHYEDASAEAAWRPHTDVYHTRRGWLIKMDLAGVRLEDISIARHGTSIRISGMRHDCVVKYGWSHYVMEMPYGHFERTIELPCDVERAGIETEYSDGLLLLHVIIDEEENDERKY